MSDVLDEVNDDLRRQKLEEFWKENGAWILGGAALAIILTAGMSFWRSYDLKHDQAQTGELLAAISSGEVSKIEGVAKDVGADHSLLARFAEARIYTQRGDRDKAAEIYNDIAQSSSGTMGDLAKLLAAEQSFDKADPAKLRATLDTLTAEKNPWRFSALEMQALLFARENKMKEAADTLTKISSDPNAPSNARERAYDLRELYLGSVN